MPKKNPHRKVVFNVAYDEDSGELQIKLEFLPALLRTESPQWKKLTPAQKHLHNYAASIGAQVMNALSKENENQG